MPNEDDTLPGTPTTLAALVSEVSATRKAAQTAADGVLWMMPRVRRLMLQRVYIPWVALVIASLALAMACAR